MARFRIKSPSGETFVVNAPDNASEQDILAYVQNNMPQQKPELKKDLVSQAIGGTLAFGQGGMPVFDEAGAGAGALMEKFGFLSPTVPEGSSLGDMYDKRLQNIRNVEKSFSEQHPVLDPTLRLSGAIAATAPFGAAMAARPVLAPAIYGGLQGYTGGEGGVADRAFSGSIGAGLGAGGGYLANKFLSPLLNRGGGGPIKPREFNAISKNLELGGVTPKDYAARLLSSTPDDFAGELGGEPLRVFTQNKAKLSGPSMSSAREAMRERLATAPQRAKNIVQETFGTDAESQALIDSIQNMKDAESGLYKQVSESIPGSELADILRRPAGKAALKDASVNYMNRYGIDIPDNLSTVSIPVDQAHEIAKSLGGQIQRNPLTGAMSDPAQGGPIESLRMSMIDKLRGVSPAFNEAQTNAANIRQAEDAYTMGRKLARMSTGEAADDAMRTALRKENITPYSVDGFKQGLYDSMENVPIGTGNPVSRIAQQRTVDRASELVGPEKAADFSRKIMAEKLRMELANRSLYGSNTPELVGEIAKDIPVIANPERWALKKLLEKGSEKLNMASEQRMAGAMFARTPDEKAALAAAILRGGYPAPPNALLRGVQREIPMLPIQTYGALMYQPSGRF